MIYDITNAKPQRPGWGFVQSTSRLLAHVSYRIGTAGAIAVDALFHIAFHRAGGSPTLLRGAMLLLTSRSIITDKRLCRC